MQILEIVSKNVKIIVVFFYIFWDIFGKRKSNLSQECVKLNLPGQNWNNYS